MGAPVATPSSFLQRISRPFLPPQSGSVSNSHITASAPPADLEIELSYASSSNRLKFGLGFRLAFPPLVRSRHRSIWSNHYKRLGARIEMISRKVNAKQSQGEAQMERSFSALPETVVTMKWLPVRPSPAPPPVREGPRRYLHGPKSRNIALEIHYCTPITAYFKASLNVFQTFLYALLAFPNAF
jgi:hypothetical protein